MKNEMATEEIKQNFHRLIDAIADEQSLVSLYEAAELYLEQRNLLLDTHNPILLARMQQSLDQIERSEFIPNAEVRQQVRQWIGK